jgi:hypothetical protein
MHQPSMYAHRRLGEVSERARADAACNSVRPLMRMDDCQWSDNGDQFFPKCCINIQRFRLTRGRIQPLSVRAPVREEKRLSNALISKIYDRDGQRSKKPQITTSMKKGGVVAQQGTN